MSDPTRAILFNYATEVIQCFNGQFTNVASIEVTEQIETELLGLSGAGSASVPSIFKDDDQNTGIYWISADALGITAGGVLRATFSSRGVIVTGLSTAISTKSTTYTVLLTDHTLLCDAVAAGFDIDLPAAATCTGQVFVIKKIDDGANVVSIDPNGSEQIDDLGAGTAYDLDAENECLTIQSTGSAWRILSFYQP